MCTKDGDIIITINNMRLVFALDVYGFFLYFCGIGRKTVKRSYGIKNVHNGMNCFEKVDIMVVKL